MRVKELSLSKKKKTTLLLTLVITTTFALILATGCSIEKSNETTETIVTETEAPLILPYSASEEEALKSIHEVDLNPDALLPEEEKLSLEGYGALGALTDTNLSLIDMLTYAAQDEYLAHGEYLAIIEKFGSQKPYSNIVRSEETHLSYLEEVYSAYDLSFPDDFSKHLQTEVLKMADLQLAVNALLAGD